VYAFADDKETIEIDTVLSMIKDKKSSRIIKASDKPNPQVDSVINLLKDKYGIVLT